MALKKICTFKGARSVAFKRAFKRLEDMEAADVPTLGAFGPILSEELQAARVEGLALIDKGLCLESEGGVEIPAPPAVEQEPKTDLFAEKVEE